MLFLPRWLWLGRSGGLDGLDLLDLVRGLAVEIGLLGPPADLPIVLTTCFGGSVAVLIARLKGDVSLLPACFSSSVTALLTHLSGYTTVVGDLFRRSTTVLSNAFRSSTAVLGNPFSSCIAVLDSPFSGCIAVLNSSFSGCIPALSNSFSGSTTVHGFHFCSSAAVFGSTLWGSIVCLFTGDIDILSAPFSNNVSNWSRVGGSFAATVLRVRFFPLWLTASVSRLSLSRIGGLSNPITLNVDVVPTLGFGHATLLLGPQSWTAARQLGGVTGVCGDFAILPRHLAGSTVILVFWDPIFVVFFPCFLLIRFVFSSIITISLFSC